MTLSTEIIILCVLLCLVAACVIVKLVLRSKLRSIDGLSGVVKQSECHGNIVGSVISDKDK